jgi:hypothetical protein
MFIGWRYSASSSGGGADGADLGLFREPTERSRGMTSGLSSTVKMT